MSGVFPVVQLGQVIEHRKEFIQISDVESYKRCRVQLHAKGIVLRDIVSGSQIKTKKQQVCRAGEFLVAEIDAKVGGFGIVPDDLDGAIVSSHYFLFEVDDSVLDRRFLDYFVRTPGFRDQVSAQGSTNYAAIRPRDVLGYQIPLPPLDEQRRIVARIEELATKIEEARGLRDSSIAEADALLKSSLREVFDTASRYHCVPLESVTSAIIDNLHSNPVYAESGVPCIRSSDVEWGRLRLDTARRTDEAEYQRRTVRGEPQQDDIVFVREGGGTGKAAIVLEGQRFSLAQRVMMVRPDKAKVEPRFFLYQLLSPQIQDGQIQPLIGGSAAPHLNIRHFRKFDFALPPLSEQREVIEHLDSLIDHIDRLKTAQTATAAELDALLPALLDQAFTGEL